MTSLEGVLAILGVFGFIYTFIYVIYRTGIKASFIRENRRCMIESIKTDILVEKLTKAGLLQDHKVEEVEWVEDEFSESKLNEELNSKMKKKGK